VNVNLLRDEERMPQTSRQREMREVQAVLTANDLRTASKLLNLDLDEERLQVLAPVVDVTLRSLQPLVRLEIENRIEPTTYLMRLKELEEA